MENKYDVIIVTTADDFKRTEAGLKRLIGNIPASRIFVIGSEEVKCLLEQSPYRDVIFFKNENEILPFDDINNIMKEILGINEVPRRVTGWYYQQFLKMQFSSVSDTAYYMSWDGDTVPSKPLAMFDELSGKPYFDLKTEYHEEYFITLNSLITGLRKSIDKSFISEHMMFKCEYMKELIEKIEGNDSIRGKYYYEKILNAIRPDKLVSNSFSEFESYGTYVLMNHPNEYLMRNWHSIRYGSIYFKPENMSDLDYEWISKDFDAVSFEKNQEYRPEINALFNDPRYRSRLSARQFIEAIQDSSEEGMREEWD